MSTEENDHTNSDQPSAKTVLVIDDEDTTLKIIENVLTQAGYNVLTSTSGEEGLKIAQENNPDIVITDVVMPNIDGFMLFKKLKSDETTKDQPVLVLSARHNVGDTFHRFGADSFLTKPIDAKLLISEIERLLG